MSTAMRRSTVTRPSRTDQHYSRAALQLHVLDSSISSRVLMFLHQISCSVFQACSKGVKPSMHCTVRYLSKRSNAQ